MSRPVRRRQLLRGALLAPLGGLGMLAGCGDATDPGAPVGRRLSERDGDSAGGAEGADDGGGVSGARETGGHAESLPDVRLEWLDRAGRSGGAEQAGDRGPVALPSLVAPDGPPVVLSVWAQWCGPCRDELPYFEKLHREVGDRLRVVGVDYLDQAEAARDFADELGLTFEQLFDPEGLLRLPLRLGVGIPATAFVVPDPESDAGNRIAHVAHRPYESLAELRSDVDTHTGIRW